MNKRVLLFVLVIFCSTNSGFCQPNYPAPSGVYCSCGPTTGVGNGSVDPAVAAKPFVKGILVRVNWDKVEPTDNNYNWSLIDGQIAAAKSYGKKISLGIGCGIAIPQWVFNAGAQRLVSMVPYTDTIAVPWNTVFLNKWTDFITALGNRYRNDTTIQLVYMTASTGNGYEMQLPFVTTPTLTAVGYTDTKMINSWKTIINAFNAAFPNHYLSNDFHPVNGSNAVADSVYAYAVTTIGNRYGANAWWWTQHNTTVYPSQYNILQNSSANNNFTGVQMAYNGTTDSASFGAGGMPAALQLAINDGVYYWEIWNQDILNPAFDSLLTNALQANADTLTTLSVKFFVEGLYIGDGEMQAVLYLNGMSTDPTACDSITVELHNSTFPYTIINSGKGLLHTDGIAEIKFPSSVINQSYYVVIRHRNAIEVWSKEAVLFNAGTTNVDFTVSLNQSTPFIGKPGVYYLGSADIAIPASNYSNPGISGAVCRFRWETLESSPNNFNWSFIDGEILKAQNANKKISLQPLGYPAWIIDSLNAEAYYYIDENTNHSTYGQVVVDVLPWDSTYVSRVKNLIQHLATKYANDTTVTYLNLIGGHFSRNLPDTVLTDTTLLIQHPFWTAFNYNADTLAVLMDTIIDYYMNLFPNTPLWCSVDYVRFENNASSRPINYLASLYTNYGLINYPDRFGLFREDLSGCNPQSVINSTSHWYIMQQNPCKTGAQMLWSVQDGPVRMNQCNMAPNTKSFVLDSAIQHGLTLGMRYMEIYGADISDTSLTAIVAAGNTALINKANQCNTTTGTSVLSGRSDLQMKCYPNPAQNIFVIELPHQNSWLEIYDATGRKYFSRKNISDKIEIDCSNFSKGVYFVNASNGTKCYNKKIIITQ